MMEMSRAQNNDTCNYAACIKRSLRDRRKRFFRRISNTFRPRPCYWIFHWHYERRADSISRHVWKKQHISLFFSLITISTILVHDAARVNVLTALKTDSTWLLYSLPFRWLVVCSPSYIGHCLWGRVGRSGCLLEWEKRKRYPRREREIAVTLRLTVSLNIVKISTSTLQFPAGVS